MASSPVLGVLGGGQLGRMLCEAAGPLGVSVAILDEEYSPAKQANAFPLHVTGSFKDPDKIRELARRCDVLTVEIEHVDTEVLEEIATRGVDVPAQDGSGRTVTKKVAVHPSWKTLRLIQDKFLQKEHFGARGLPVAEQMAIASGAGAAAALEEAARRFGLPFMLKGRKNSYDGRGNLVVTSVAAADLEGSLRQMGNQPLYAEKMVPFAKELAVMVIRTESEDGKQQRTMAYPAVETIHEDSICTRVYMPPRDTTEKVSKAAQALACKVIDSLWGRGVFAVEMFLLKDGSLVVNEVAPRPHNSGHYTIEAIPQMSQYKAQVAAILDRIPPNLSLRPWVSSAIMVNILGGAGPDSHKKLVDLAWSLGGDDLAVHLHLYGKAAKPARKIGHITTTGRASIAELEVLTMPFIDEFARVREERINPGGGTASLTSKVIKSLSLGDAQTGTASPAPAPLVLVTMGSDSDLPVLKAGLDILKRFDVPFEVNITSAHRTPSYMAEVAFGAVESGFKVIIAAAGGAAHLPGMMASHTPLPVIGVPVKATHLDGQDSLLSIVQMPRGIPCATVGINNSTNAALLAIRILGTHFPEYVRKMEEYQHQLESEVLQKGNKLREVGYEDYLAGMNKK